MPGSGSCGRCTCRRTRRRGRCTWPGRSRRTISGFPDIELPVGYGQSRTATGLPVLTMVSAYSRMLFARLLPTRTAQDLYAGWWLHLARLGAVPRVLVWDGEGAVGQYGRGRN